MPKRQARVGDEPSSRLMHHQHCLYLLAEAERMIDRTGAGWSPAEAGLVKFRLLRISEKLTGLCKPSRQKGS